METPDSMVDPEAAEKFRTSFAFDDKEKLLGCAFFPCLTSPFRLT